MYAMQTCRIIKFIELDERVLEFLTQRFKIGEKREKRVRQIFPIQDTSSSSSSRTLLLNWPTYLADTKD